MKVKELIERLKDFPESTEVVIRADMYADTKHGRLHYLPITKLAASRGEIMIYKGLYTEDTMLVRDIVPLSEIPEMNTIEILELS